jgi:ribonuclease P protein component
MRNFTFKKAERLSSKILLDKLFSGGRSLFSYPYKFIFLETEQVDVPEIRVVFSVPKRNFKQAVKRNLIRRRMKEAYRLNKHAFTDNIDGKKFIIMVIYTEKSILDYKHIETGLIKGFKKVISTIN